MIYDLIDFKDRVVAYASACIDWIYATAYRAAEALFGSDDDDFDDWRHA